MWSSRLFWKLFVVYAGLNLTLAIGFLLVLSYWHRQQVHRQIEQRLHDTAVVLSSHVDEQLEILLDGQADPEVRDAAYVELQTLLRRVSRRTGSRLTLIDMSGQVLADSDKDPKEMENHRDRPELVQAAEVGQGVEIRRSPTLGIEMLYLALRIQKRNQTVALTSELGRGSTFQVRLPIA